MGRSAGRRSRPAADVRLLCAALAGWFSIPRLPTAAHHSQRSAGRHRSLKIIGQDSNYLLIGFRAFQFSFLPAQRSSVLSPPPPVCPLALPLTLACGLWSVVGIRARVLTQPAPQNPSLHPHCLSFPPSLPRRCLSGGQLSGAPERLSCSPQTGPAAFLTPPDQPAAVVAPGWPRTAAGPDRMVRGPDYLSPVLSCAVLAVLCCAMLDAGLPCAVLCSGTLLCAVTQCVVPCVALSIVNSC